MRHLLTLFLLAPWSLFAQDYTVTAKGDTLYGKIQILTFDVYDRVEVVQGAYKDRKTHSLKATEVREVRMGDGIYHPQHTYEGYRMLKLRTPGYVSYYYGHHQKSTLYEVPCLVRKDGKYLEVPGFGFKKLMSSFLSDCEIVSVKIQQGEWTKKDLELILEEYNKCIVNQSKITTPPPVVVADNPSIDAIGKLIAKIEKDTDFSMQKDALDLSRDIEQKLKEGKDVPRYMVEGLKSTLKDNAACQEELKTLLALIEKP